MTGLIIIGESGEERVKSGGELERNGESGEECERGGEREWDRESHDRRTYGLSSPGDHELCHLPLGSLYEASGETDWVIILGDS